MQEAEKMIASIWKIVTDHEGESKITFCVPLSEIADVVRLNALLQKQLVLDVKERIEECQISAQ
jgi:hypothetical protein